MSAKSADSEQGKDKKAKGTPRNKTNNKPRIVKNPLEEADFFGEQYNKTEDLEDPNPLLKMLAPAVVEVIAGVRNISQLAAVLSDDVYQRLRDRAIAVSQNRVRDGLPPKAPMLSVGALQRKDPKDGVIESVVLVQSPTRTRAVTIRLEGINHRWRATAVSVI
ncbi:MAG: hypothetical protein RL319_304 [Actinomycetota bacterium]|jgi:hypothetical protein